LSNFRYCLAVGAPVRWRCCTSLLYSRPQQPACPVASRPRAQGPVLSTRSGAAVCSVNHAHEAFCGFFETSSCARCTHGQFLELSATASSAMYLKIGRAGDGPTGACIGPAHNQRRFQSVDHESEKMIQIALGLSIVCLLAGFAGLAAAMLAVLLGQPKAVVVAWGGKATLCMAGLGLTALALILTHA
jgi:hypothetical protein